MPPPQFEAPVVGSADSPLHKAATCRRSCSMLDRRRDPRYRSSDARRGVVGRRRRCAPAESLRDRAGRVMLAFIEGTTGRPTCSPERRHPSVSLLPPPRCQQAAPGAAGDVQWRFDRLAVCPDHNCLMEDVLRVGRAVTFPVQWTWRSHRAGRKGYALAGTMPCHARADLSERLRCRIDPSSSKVIPHGTWGLHWRGSRGVRTAQRCSAAQPLSR